MSASRKSGVLLPISALPSKYGIGCFSKEAYQFIDLLAESGQSLWQILPLGPTGYGDSPYQSFSTFAGNPYFIDLEQLIEQGLLTADECETADFGSSDTCVDYEKLYDNRYRILRNAYKRGAEKGMLVSAKYLDFCQRHTEWLEDYALFMALKQQFSGQSWEHWDADIRKRKPCVVRQYREQLEEEIAFYKYLRNYSEPLMGSL